MSKKPAASADRPIPDELAPKRFTNEIAKRLRKLAAGEGGKPETFIRGLEFIRDETKEDGLLFDEEQRAYDVLGSIRDAVILGRTLLNEPRIKGRQGDPFNRLGELMDLLLDSHAHDSAGHRRPHMRFFGWLPGDEANAADSNRRSLFTYRECLLRRFDTEDFLGLRRFAKPSELALLSLFLEPSLVRDRISSGATSFKEVMKYEKDALAMLRKRLRASDPLYPRPR